MVVGHLPKKKSERKKQIIYKPEPSRASTEQSGTAPKRIRTEPERNRAEPSRSGAGPKLSASERSRAGRHAEGTRKARGRQNHEFWHFFPILFRAMPDRSRAGVGPHRVRVGSGSDRHGSARVRSDRVGFGSDARIFSGRGAHALVEGIKCPTAIYKYTSNVNNT